MFSSVVYFWLFNFINHHVMIANNNLIKNLNCPWKMFLSIRMYICSRFYYHGSTLIPAWISNLMPSKVWDEITYPFLNVNGATVEV